MNNPTFFQRIIAGLCYPTFGIPGLVYLLATGRSNQPDLLRFHFIQSILLWLIGYLLNMVAGILIGIICSLVSVIATKEISILIFKSIGLAALILTNTFYLLLAYGAIWAFLGKFAEVPFISNVVRQNMRF